MGGRFGVVVAVVMLAGVMALGQGPGAGFSGERPRVAGGVTWEQAEVRIRALVAGAPQSLLKYPWGNRGPAPLGYFKGMALSYAHSYHSLRTEPNSALKAMSQPIGLAKGDALAYYDIVAPTAVDRLRAVYTLAIGLGMRESSGNTTEGWDRSKLKLGIENTEDNAEAGLFQFSWDTMGERDPLPALLRQLYDDYRAGASDRCMLSTFMEASPGKSLPDKNAAVEGSGDGARFQTFTKQCPAFAAEYVAVMLRLNRSHFGPINNFKKPDRKPDSAEYLPEVEALLRQVEKIADGVG